jgi:DNA polymerase III, delta subunit
LIKYGNIADIFRKFYEQLNFGSTGINILEQITRILYDTQYIYFLKLELDSLEDVAQKSGINIYRVKLLDSFVIKVGYETIKKLIKSLAQLDVDIKKGLIDENLGIKTFMLTLLA